MTRGSVRRAVEPPLDGRVEGSPWERADPLSIDRFPWDTTEHREDTTVRLLYDDRAVYLQFQATADRCSAAVTDLNGPVYEDSCVEFFASPPSVPPDSYFNFEANCVGTFLLGYGTPTDRRRVDAPLAEAIRVETSVPGPTATGPLPDGADGWWLAAALPFDALGTFAGVAVDPGPGTEWRANLYRCGGEVDPQFAAWAPIDAPEPDFHRPAAFGTLVFE